MDILQFNEEHNMFRDSLKKFLAKEVIPHIEEWEEAMIVPRDIWKKMGEQGFLCMNVPEEYGGMAGDLLFSVVLWEEMVKTNFTGLQAALHSDVVVPYIVSFGSEEIKKKYLPGCVSGDIITAVSMTEPNAGSDLAAIRTTAVEDGDDVIINGQKTFVSNGILSDLVIVAAKDPSVQNPHKAMDLYVVEAGTPGFSKGRQLKKAGWHSQDTSELYFEDCRVPKANRLGQKGGGFIMLMQKLQQERLGCAFFGQCMAEFSLDVTIKYCKERMMFGKPLSSFQHTQFEIAEMAADIKIGRAFIEKCIVEHMEGKNIVTEVSMAKFWLTEMACRVADRCLQLHGGYGYCEEYPIARAWRDSRILRIFAGANEVMRVIVAANMGL